MNIAEKANVADGFRERYIPVITRKETTRVNIREILYLESELRTVNIYTDSRVYRFYGKLDDMIKYLSSSFYRCHKSCVINLDKITKMEDGIFHFVSGTTLRVGQNNYRLTRSHYIKFLRQNAKVDGDLSR